MTKAEVPTVFDFFNGDSNAIQKQFFPATEIKDSVNRLEESSTENNFRSSVGFCHFSSGALFYLIFFKVLFFVSYSLYDLISCACENTINAFFRLLKREKNCTTRFVICVQILRLILFALC